MPITIKEIAKLAGVSRGTVDRVLNNRPGASAQAIDIVQKIINEYGYTPNKAGKVLATNKNPITIGVALNSIGNPFFDEVKNGIEDAYFELKDFGLNLEVIEQKGYEPKKQQENLKLLKEKNVNAILFTPINHTSVVKFINENLIQIPIATLNQDIKGVDKLFYIGCDYEKSGRTAGHLMGMICKNQANIGIITGSIKILGHNKRVHGFSRVFKENFANMHIVEIVENNDDDEISYQVTKDMLVKNLNINALYFAAAGIEGGMKAVIELGFKGNIVCFDETEAVKKYIKSGHINATICQEPYKQGYEGIKTLYEIVSGLSKISSDLIITQTQIKIKENI